MVTKAQTRRDEIAEARERLLAILKPGQVVWTVLRHVSASGMSRRIDLYSINGQEHSYLSGYAGCVLGMKRHDKQGLVVGGCGMDMGFHLVYSLSRALWPDGHECAGQGCPSNDHSNGDQNYSPDHLHEDGGYALRQRWL